MENRNIIVTLARSFVAFFVKLWSPVRWKEMNEFRYWKKRRKAEGELLNDHYKYFYCTHFGLNDSFYAGKTLLDIGCGPRGSLEWATMAARRIGLDPLADKYLRLGAEKHKMEYINAPSEKIPLSDASCDSVFSFNSLDHVDDVDQTIEEIKRITRPGGVFLLIVEINHAPTDCEPHWLTPVILIDSLGPEFDLEELKVFKPVPGCGVYESIHEGDVIENPKEAVDPGYLSARFIRR